MKDPTRLWFIRHGEVEAPYVGAFVGRLDVGLSGTGRHQAEAVRTYLEEAPLDAVLASPRRRARDCAGALARARGMHVETRDGFAEMDFGEWEGLQWPEIEARDAAYAASWQEDPASRPCPGGETADGFARRVQDALDGTLEEFRGRRVALYAHAGTNRAILAALTRRPYMEAFVFAQDYGCVNAAAWDAAGFGQVALVNLVPGPRSADQGDGGRPT